MRRYAPVAVACALALTAWPLPGKKKKEDETQVLQLPKELPNAVVGETRRLAFHVTPLSARGLLSQQIRDALKALTRQSGGSPVLKIRAFVAGTGDLRRVRDLVSETFTERKQPLPTLSLVHAGGLPMEGAQVVLEAVTAGRKDVHPNGLVFLSALTATSNSPLDPVLPLTQKVVADLAAAVKAAGSEPADVLRITCFFSTLENLAASRKLVEADYPAAAMNFVQTQRSPIRASAACEAVARLRWNTGKRLHLIRSEGVTAEPGQSLAALVSARQIVFTGTQVSFGYQEADAKLAFGRLRKAVEQAGGAPGQAVFVSYYPLSPSIAELVRKIRAGFFDEANPPASSLQLVEALPSMDAGFAVDLVAVKE
jgi:enamine deaminase RidA (YjgF/YER057c/UK114 family)